VATIGQIMNKRVVALDHDASVGEAVVFLTEHHIGGAPVVNKQLQPLGMVSELSLIDIVFDPAVKDEPITRFMNPDVQSVKPGDSLAKAAQLFALFSFRRLPVVDEGHLVGIVTRRDLMNYALQTGSSIADPLGEILPALAACHSDASSLEFNEYELA
jgi:tRNA nucleotidyltransferase (CCA-adding enzyme)